MNVTVITNNIPRDVIKVNGARLVSYRGELIDLDEFDRAHAGMPRPLTAWHNYRSTSIYSGILIKYVDDHKRVIVGNYYLS